MSAQRKVAIAIGACLVLAAVLFLTRPDSRGPVDGAAMQDTATQATQQLVNPKLKRDHQRERLQQHTQIQEEAGKLKGATWSYSNAHFRTSELALGGDEGRTRLRLPEGEFGGTLVIKAERMTLKRAQELARVILADPQLVLSRPKDPKLREFPVMDSQRVVAYTVQLGKRQVVFSGLYLVAQCPGQPKAKPPFSPQLRLACQTNPSLDKSASK